MLKLADNLKEVQYILANGQVSVDGVVRRDYKFPVGIFDVVSIPATKMHYRVLLNSRGKFVLCPTKDLGAKLCRVNSKTTIPGGVIQLNLHDGSNIIGSDNYHPGDSVVLKLPERKIVKRLEHAPGNLAMVVRGRHAGEIGTIKEMRGIRGPQPNMVTIKGDTEFETIKEYIFIIGAKKPAIDLGVVRK
jgi:small subunit ribosomal protein S4e